jgi:hypothetical protein
MDDRDKLLEEYKLCQDTVTRLEETVWKTSTAMGLGSFGSLVALISLNQRPKQSSILILGLLVFFTSLIWWFMAKRWWNIQHATFLRMKHIEESLHFFQVSYIYHKDRKLNLCDKSKGFDIPDSHIEELNKLDRKFHRWGVQSWLRLLPFLILYSWVSYAFSACFTTTTVVLILTIVTLTTFWLNAVFIVKVETTKNKDKWEKLCDKLERLFWLRE